MAPNDELVSHMLNLCVNNPDDNKQLINSLNRTLSLYLLSTNSLPSLSPHILSFIPPLLSAEDTSLLTCTIVLAKFPSFQQELLPHLKTAPPDFFSTLIRAILSPPKGFTTYFYFPFLNLFLVNGNDSVHCTDLLIVLEHCTNLIVNLAESSALGAVERSNLVVTLDCAALILSISGFSGDSLVDLFNRTHSSLCSLIEFYSCDKVVVGLIETLLSEFNKNYN
ncbi:hypothetical protein P9112_014030 [Eukaryota sp. TZLM1-RC]